MKSVMIVLLAIGLLAGCSSSNSTASADVVARVDGKDITVAQLEKQFQVRAAGAPQPPSPEEAQDLKLQLLNEMINDQIFLELATKQSDENPVFYVQYAHARTRSAFRQAEAAFPGIDLSDAALAAADVARLDAPAELALIKTLCAWPRLLEAAVESGEPHRIAFFLYDLAAAFHTLWTRGKEDTALRFIVADDRAQTLARLALVRGVGLIVASGLRLMGVEPVEEMR